MVTVKSGVRLARTIGAGAAFALLSGCMEGGGLQMPSLSFGTNKEIVELAVAGGDVTIQGPKGFCIDKRGSSDRSSGAFVLLASCAAIQNDPDAPRPNARALLTASVSGDGAAAPDITAQADALAFYFESEEGRATLARDGNGQSLEVLTTAMDGDVFIIHARDNSTDSTPALAEDHWRAIFVVNERLIAASVMEVSTRKLASEEGEALLKQFVSRIRTASAPENG